MIIKVDPTKQYFAITDALFDQGFTKQGVAEIQRHFKKETIKCFYHKQRRTWYYIRNTFYHTEKGKCFEMVKCNKKWLIHELPNPQEY